MAIVKILKSTSTFSAVSYNEKRCKNGEAILLTAKNFSLPDTLLPYSDYLISWSSKNKRIKNTQFHVTISIKDNSLSKEQLLKISEEWLNKMGYGNNPYLIYYHSNTKHPHVHIVSSRVDKNGNKINDSFEKERALKFLHEIEGINQSLDNRNTLAHLLHYSFSTKYQFIELAKSSGFDVWSEDERIFCKKGESKIHIDNKLIDFCVNRYHREIDLKEKKKIQGLIYKYATLLSKESFTKYMKDKFGLNFIFYGKKGDINGYTIIDYKNKRVYKGSEIFGAKKLSELLNIPESPVVDYEFKIQEFLNDNPYATPHELNELLFSADEYILEGDNLVNVFTGESYILGSALINKLQYNNRLHYFINCFNPYDNDTYRIVAQLGRLKIEDVQALSSPIRPDHDMLLEYKTILERALNDNESFMQVLASRGLSLYFDDDQFFILDSVNKRIVSNNLLNINLSNVTTKIDSDNDNTIDNQQDYNDAFDIYLLPSFDFAGLIFTGKVSGARSGRRKKRH